MQSTLGRSCFMTTDLALPILEWQRCSRTVVVSNHIECDRASGAGRIHFSSCPTSLHMREPFVYTSHGQAIIHCKSIADTSAPSTFLGQARSCMAFHIAAADFRAHAPPGLPCPGHIPHAHLLERSNDANTARVPVPRRLDFRNATRDAAANTARAQSPTASGIRKSDA